MLVLTEKNFKEQIQKYPKVLVMFYRDKGCQFCDITKPEFLSIDESKEKDFQCAKYEITQMMELFPDAVMQSLGIKMWPTFVAFENGNAVGFFEGALKADLIPKVFTSHLLPQKRKHPKSLKLVDLKVLEMNLIDQLSELNEYFGMVKVEIERREKLANGSIKSCCGSCASGGSCEGGGCH